MQHSDLLLQRAYETPENLKHTFATSEEGRDCDLVMSRAEVERRGGAGVDNGHDLLVRNGGIGSTSTRQGMGHGAQERGTGHGTTR
jgi:hypothetical protein